MRLADLTVCTACQFRLMYKSYRVKEPVIAGSVHDSGINGQVVYVKQGQTTILPVSG
jgi:hypothetical protein